MQKLKDERVLYLGLEPPNENYLHYPVIGISPLKVCEPAVHEALKDFSAYTHLIFTSKTAVRCLFDLLLPEQKLQVKDCCTIAVGNQTAAVLRDYGLEADHIAEKEQAEGVVEILDSLDLSDSYVFWPRSSLARNLIAEYLHEKGIRYRDTALYETFIQQPHSPLPSLDSVDEIIFTSPSTVDGFLEIFGPIPHCKKITAIGPITQSALDRAKEIL